jgi:hypothetical protein
MDRLRDLLFLLFEFANIYFMENGYYNREIRRTKLKHVTRQTTELTQKYINQFYKGRSLYIEAQKRFYQ